MHRLTFVFGIGSLLLLPFSTGCATALRGQGQTLKFVTEPPAATVQVVSNGKPTDKFYTTPADIRLRRNQAHDITIAKTGYQPITFQMVARWDGASIPGFLLPGGSASVAADRASGADLAFYPLPTIKLTPSATPTTQPVKLYQYMDRLCGKAEYDQLMAQEEKDKRGFITP